MSAPEVPSRVMPGLVSWKNEHGFRVVAWHYRSDPGKQGTWEEEVSIGVPGGRASDHWRQEYDIDPYIVTGKLTYYAFKRERNVINELPTDIGEFRTWPWFLSADFGSSESATCFLFWAENPRTNDLYIFDEVYVDEAYAADERTPEHIKPIVYDRLRFWAGVPEGQPLDIRSCIKYAIGDPSGLSYMQEYRKSPMPIPIGYGVLDAKVKINNEEAGESRLNAYFSLSFTCCPAKDNPEGRYYTSKGMCPKCHAVRSGSPRLRILSSGCPRLIRQLPTIRKKLAKREGELAPEGNVKVENHAVDACRYGAMSRPVIKQPLTRPSVDKPVREMVIADRFWDSVQNRQDHAKLASLYDDGEYDADREELVARINRRDNRDIGAVIAGPW